MQTDGLERHNVLLVGPNTAFERGWQRLLRSSPNDCVVAGMGVAG
ncbi:hypothetical protein [Natronorubrum bangense]|nr:hypothetical protein [Natronorubrum bangense]